MKLGANDCVYLLRCWIFCLILYKSLFYWSVLLFFLFLRFFCLWFGFFLWQTTVRFSLLVLHFSFIRLKIWIGFHFCCIFYSFYKHDIFLEFFFTPTLLFIALAMIFFFTSLCNFRINHVCVCVSLSVFE